MGIDYGLGKTNIDGATGIRFGVISQNEVLQAWCDSSEADYGPASCPKCGNEAAEYDDSSLDEVDEFDGVSSWSCCDFVCESCRVVFGSDEAYGDEPRGFVLDDGEYKASQSGDDSDIFIVLSPFYTFAPFCSPCAPGAGYIIDGAADGDCRAYCFGHDWFENGVAPYPVYSVADGREVYPAGLSF